MPQHPRQRLADLFAIYGSRYAGALRETTRRRFEAAGALTIFGAGQNGRRLLDSLSGRGIGVQAFIDETPSKRGTELAGVPIVDLDQAAAMARPLAIVSTFSPRAEYLQIAGRLRARGIDTVPLFTALWAIAPDALPFYFMDGPQPVLDAAEDLEWLADRLVDTASADLLCAHVEFRLSQRYEALPLWRTERIAPIADGYPLTLIDAGAFDGDTLLPLVAANLDRTRAAFGLEPDPASHAALSRAIEAAPEPVRRVTTAVAVAVDRRSGERTFANLGHQGSSFADEGRRIATCALDDFVEAHADPDTSLYIKLDVEGAEEDALAGAERTISTRRPLLSVSAYHRPADLWRLPRMIGAIDDGYRYEIRSHGADGADLMINALPPS